MTWIKMLTLLNVILRRSGVVKLSISSQIFNATEKYLDFAKFHPSQVWSGQKSIFWARFSAQIKIFLDFVKFHPLLAQSGQHSHFLAKFSAWLKISGFCQISSFACPEWSKLSILGLILIAIENFWILPHSSFACPEWSKMSVVS